MSEPVCRLLVGAPPLLQLALQSGITRTQGQCFFQRGNRGVILPETTQGDRQIDPAADPVGIDTEGSSKTLDGRLWLLKSQVADPGVEG